MLDSIQSSLKDNQRNITIALVTIAVFGVIGYVIYVYSRPKLLTQIQREDAPEGGEGGGDAEIIFFFANWCPHCKSAKPHWEIIFFFANWCPHCKSAKPHWEEVKKSYSGKSVNGYNLIFTEVDCSEESEDTKKMTKQYEIEGYPTIKLVKDDQVIDFDAKPDKTTLEKFINTVI